MSSDDDKTRDLTLGPGDQPSDGSVEQWKSVLSAEDHADLKPGDQVGPFKVVGALGEGGFGRVWLAERRTPFFQRVALKVLKRGMDSRAVLARFEQERQALALMDHPNIAKVVDGGTTDAGQPYFVMEYVKGEPLTQYCDRHHMPIADRLGLFVLVCEAVQHAHIKGIIHRDIKPSNILVEVVDGKPVPKVIDFGVAKALGQALSAHTVFTSHGQMVGTPEYMSPEQAEGTVAGVDTRTDVYSLGIVLYELLAGTLPFEAAELRNAGAQAIHRIIREQEAPKPSTKLQATGDRATAVAQRRSMKLDTLRGTLSRELEWIPMKAIRKDPDRRYRSPDELALDVRNYLEGRGLIAGPETISYRARKAMRRHWRPFAAVAAVILALGAGMTWALVERGKALTAEAVAKESQRRIEEARASELDMRRDTVNTLHALAQLVFSNDLAESDSDRLPQVSNDEVGKAALLLRREIARAKQRSDPASAYPQFAKLRSDVCGIFGAESEEADEIACAMAPSASGAVQRQEMQEILVSVIDRRRRKRPNDAGETANALNALAVVESGTELTEDAIKGFREALQLLDEASLADRAVPIAENLSLVLLQSKRHREALDVAQANELRIQRTANVPGVQLMLARIREGQALAGLQRNAEAVRALQSSVAEMLQRSLREFDAAEQALTLAAQLTPENDVKARLRTMTMQAELSWSKRDLIRAAMALEFARSLAADPRVPRDCEEHQQFEFTAAKLGAPEPSAE